MWRYNPSGTPGTGGDSSAGRPSDATAAVLHAENGGYVATK